MPTPLESEVNVASGPLSETFGNYVLLKRISVGGMAEVYLGNLKGVAGFSKPVVIKAIRPNLVVDPDFVELFLDEGRLAARLSHPNITQTFELGEANGRHFIAMEYVMGESLAAIAKRAWPTSRPIPLVCVLRVLLQLCEALNYAHTLSDDSGKPLKIVHRDVTSTNVMVTYHGDVKLLDFGIARAASQHHQTQPGIVRGKLGFMAPEQLLGHPVDQRADVFAAGAILYSLTTGRYPYENLASPDPLERYRVVAEARFVRPRTINSEIPVELERIILRAMERDPGDRYPDARTMLQDLEALAAKVGLYPSASQLAEYLGGLFPERALLFSGGKIDSSKLSEIEELCSEDIAEFGSEDIAEFGSVELDEFGSADRSGPPEGASGSPDALASIRPTRRGLPRFGAGSESPESPASPGSNRDDHLTRSERSSQPGTSGDAGRLSSTRPSGSGDPGGPLWGALAPTEVVESARRDQQTGFEQSSESGSFDGARRETSTMPSGPSLVWDRRRELLGWRSGAIALVLLALLGWAWWPATAPLPARPEVPVVPPSNNEPRPPPADEHAPAAAAVPVHEHAPVAVQVNKEPKPPPVGEHGPSAAAVPVDQEPKPPPVDEGSPSAAAAVPVDQEPKPPPADEHSPATAAAVNDKPKLPPADEPPAAAAPTPPSPGRVNPPAAPPAKAPEPRPPRPRNARLWLDTYPWATVREGGQKLGETPITLQLAPGKHVLVLENEQGQLRKTLEVTVRPGEEKRLPLIQLGR